MNEHRLIKFRVWDKQTKSMLSDFHLFGEVTLMGGIHAWQHEQGNKSESSIEALGDLVEMQFTGFVDKDGNDIYEGDFVKSKNFIFACEWINAGFHLVQVKVKSPRHWSLKLASATSVKVIGNIYENPELLN